MEARMLNTQVPVLAEQLFWVLKDGQLSLKISILKATINCLFFSELWWVVRLGYLGKYSIREKYILIGPVSSSWTQIEGRPSAAHTFSRSEINSMFPDKTWECLKNKQEDQFLSLYTLIVNSA